MDKKTAMKRLVAGYAAKHGLTENGSRPTWTSADGGPAKCPTPSSARASGKSALVRECIEGMATAKKLQKKRGGGPLPGVICCAVCLKPGANRRCGKCRGVSYCSTACQRSDWKTHKGTCVAHASYAPAPAQTLEHRVAAVYAAVDAAVSSRGLEAVATGWRADRLEALCDGALIPLLQIVPPEDTTPHEGVGYGLRTLGLLFLRYGAKPTTLLVEAVRAHRFVEAADAPNAVDPAAYVVARARLGPECYPSGHPLREPNDNDLATLLDVLTYRLGSDAARWRPELDLGLGSEGEGTVEIIEAMLRQFVGVQEPAPSGAVDLAF